MYPVSGAFKTAVRQSHTAKIKAEVWRGSTKVLDLETLDGTVDVDARRNVRRTCMVTVAAPDPTIVLDRAGQTYAALAAAYTDYADLDAAVVNYADIELTDEEVVTEVDAGVVPDTALSALAPFGNELRLWRGIRVERTTADNYADLSSEWGSYSSLGAAYANYEDLSRGITDEDLDEYVPLGVFLITRVDVSTNRSGTTVQINGSDRSLRVSRARWTAPYEVSGNSGTAIEDILEDRYTEIETDFTSTSKTINRAFFGLEAANDPWADAQKIATAAGMELFFDGDGIARLIPTRDYETATPDAIYREDEEAMVLSLTRSLTNEDTFNGVIAVGEGSESSATFRGEAWDEDIDSPTYRYGPFGEVPMFFSSPLFTSNDDAVKSAESILSRKKGTTEAVEWAQIVDPSLDVGDVIALTNAAAKVDRLMVLDRISIPLAPTGEMRAVARTIRSLGGTGFEEAESAA